MKRTVLVTLGLLVTTGALISLAAWEPWKSREREHEVEWIEVYAAWSDRIDDGLASGDTDLIESCESDYRADLDDPPARLVDSGRIVLEGCRRVRELLHGSDLDFDANLFLDAAADEWRDIRMLVLADLTNRRARASSPDQSPELAKRAEPLVGTQPDVLCWSSTNWEELSEEWSLIRVDELWPIGFADLEGGRIHLAPQICGPLHRFFGGNYAPSLNEESLDLAVALVTLAHEAEHLRSPESTEAQVECVAIQRVRDLVRDAGRSKPYEDLMTGLAWDVGYPNVPPDYRTAECHDGSALDVRPETSVWP